MSEQDIRWKQPFQNFLKVFALLESAVDQYNKEDLTDLEEQGLIQRFEFTNEMAWNVLKDYFEYQGNTNITGSRDATREAFNKGLIQDGENWMHILKSRNKSSLTYNKETAKELVSNITKSYYNFKDKMISLLGK